MPLNLTLCLLLFPVVILGLAWPLVSRLALDAAEKLCATVALSLLGVYLLAFARYLLGLPVGAFWALPVLAAVGLVTGRRALADLLGDPHVRALLLGLLLLAGWCLGWLSFVVFYSGGGWSGDWVEHWQRTRFFLEHWPLQTKFLTLFFLPARPPLANLVTGALLGPTGVNFPAYQLISSLLNCLVFLPAALLARRFCLRPDPEAPLDRSRVALAVLVLLLMLNPSFVENATFAWTKLITAFFSLSALYFFLRAQDPAPAPAAAPLCAVCLAAGLLAHYSAGPYVLLLVVAWFALGHRRWRDPTFWRQTAIMGLVGGLILATWFGWSLMIYGPGATFSNASAAGAEAPPGGPLVMIARNLRDTVVPHFLRIVDPDLITQRSSWGYWRDWFFQLYQVNLLYIFGSVGWLVLARELVRGASSAPARSRWFWAAFASGAVVLGVAAVAGRDHWGLAHICLQALLLLGLAYVAARWTVLGPAWQLVLVIGAVFDFLFGIALQFGVQSHAFDGWRPGGGARAEILTSYSEIAMMNLRAKYQMHVDFLGEALRVPGALVLALLAVILTLAVVRAARRPG